MLRENINDASTPKRSRMLVQCVQLVSGVNEPKLRVMFQTGIEGLRLLHEVAIVCEMIVPATECWPIRSSEDGEYFEG